MQTYFFIWRVEPRNIPRALLHMAVDRISLRSNPHISFFKSLGTGAGKTFTPNDADLRTWALVITTTLSKDELTNLSVIAQWRSFAQSEALFELEAISAHGLWAKQQPFPLTRSSKWDGEVATITRAKIAWHENFRFWRAVPPVTDSLLGNSGLIQAIGIGEAPVGLQGTFSHWESQAALRAFAYQGEAHQRAIAQTAERQWYKEELFARFAVISHSFVTLKR